MGKFLIASGEMAGRKFSVLPGTTIVVGRANADVNIKDTKASRRHCEIVALEDSDIVRDLMSRNGTFLDGRRIEEVILVPGNVLQLGVTKLEYIGIVDPLTTGKTIVLRSATLTAERDAAKEVEEERKPGEREEVKEAEEVLPGRKKSARMKAAKARLDAVKRDAMGEGEHSMDLISAKGRFCEACGEAIFAGGEEEAGEVVDGQFLCRMCALIARKQKEVGGDYLPSYAKIVREQKPAPETEQGEAEAVAGAEEEEASTLRSKATAEDGAAPPSS